VGRKFRVSELNTGDLVFFNTIRLVRACRIYTADKQVCSFSRPRAARSGVDDMDDSYWEKSGTRALGVLRRTFPIDGVDLRQRVSPRSVTTAIKFWNRSDRVLLTGQQYKSLPFQQEGGFCRAASSSQGNDPRFGTLPKTEQIRTFPSDWDVAHRNTFPPQRRCLPGTNFDTRIAARSQPCHVQSPTFTGSTKCPAATRTRSSKV